MQDIVKFNQSTNQPQRFHFIEHQTFQRINNLLISKPKPKEEPTHLPLNITLPFLAFDCSESRVRKQGVRLTEPNKIVNEFDFKEKNVTNYRSNL
jgi:hypothetical protein